MHGPGTIPEIKTKHHVRLDMGKVDHFVEFIDRPYFYQDVSYGNKVLTLDNGDRIDKVYNDWAILGVLQRAMSRAT